MSASDNRDEPKFVTELNPNDVLMGRGTPSAEYEGNLRFRKLVAERREVYLKCERRKDKHVISQQIVEKVHDRGGRFLQRITTAEEAAELKVPPRKQAWKVIEASTTLFAKVKQLMRDVGPETKQKRKERRDEQKVLVKSAAPKPPPTPQPTKDTALNSPPTLQFGPRHSSSAETSSMSNEDSKTQTSSSSSQNRGFSMGHEQPASSSDVSSSPTATPASDQNAQLVSLLLNALLQQQQQQQQQQHDFAVILLTVLSAVVPQMQANGAATTAPSVPIAQTGTLEATRTNQLLSLLTQQAPSSVLPPPTARDPVTTAPDRPAAVTTAAASAAPVTQNPASPDVLELLQQLLNANAGA